MERTYDEETYKRINRLLRERTCVQIERSEDAIRIVGICVRKTTSFYINSWRIKIALESYLEEHAQEVWGRNWMNSEMQTALLNTFPAKLIATILKALREQLQENDQLNAVEEIAGPVPEINPS